MHRWHSFCGLAEVQLHRLVGEKALHKRPARDGIGTWALSRACVPTSVGRVESVAAPTRPVAPACLPARDLGWAMMIDPTIDRSALSYDPLTLQSSMTADTRVYGQNGAATAKPVPFGSTRLYLCEGYAETLAAPPLPPSLPHLVDCNNGDLLQLKIVGCPTALK